MKKGIILILLIVFLIFFSVNMIFASSSFGGVFGGKIINTKAVAIATLEATGYICSTFGTSISIVPLGSPAGTPSNYFIPSFITSKTGSSPAISQSILGRYSGQTAVTCTNVETEDIKTVMLSTITLFGTSRSFSSSGAAKAMPSGPASK